MRPLWIGASGPTTMSRTTECTPSAPIDGIGRGTAAVGERQGDGACVLVEADEPAAEVDDLRRQGREQRLVQIGAVHAEVGRAVEALRHRQLAGDLAGVPHAVQVREGRERDAAQPLVHADLAQHLHGVGHHLDAGADAGEVRRLLVDARFHAEPAQRGGNRKAADAGADDGNREGLGHGMARSDVPSNGRPWRCRPLVAAH